MPTKTTSRPVKVQSGTALRKTFVSWVHLRAQVERETATVNALKTDVLLPSLEQNGEEDERGSQFIEFSLPIEVEETKNGKTVTVTYTGIKRERRVSQSFDEAKAEELLRAKGLWLEERHDKALRNVLNAVPALRIALSVDQDAFREYFYSNKISEAELDSCFTESVTYAFVPQKQ